MVSLAAFTDHGGRLDAARALFGGEDWIDLSTGIAPWAYPVAGLALGLDRLPEPGAIKALEAAAGAAFGVDDPAGVVAVPGTDLAMRLLADVIDAARPNVVEPGYAGHRAAWPGAGRISEDEVFGPCASTGSARTERMVGVHTPPGVILPTTVRPELVEGRVAGTPADLLVLASPTNPSGRSIDPATLTRLTGRMTVVLDQAYADPAPCPPVSDRLIVLRSFGKFYGLPGLRLGFVVAPTTIAARLRTRLGDWPVSSVAVAVGTAAYGDRVWRDAQATRIAAMALRLDAVLDKARLSVIGRAPLFRLIETDAARLFERLAQRAILTRPFAARPDWLRIGLPCDDAALARLAAALEDHQ